MENPLTTEGQDPQVNTELQEDVTVTPVADDNLEPVFTDPTEAAAADAICDTDLDESSIDALFDAPVETTNPTEVDPLTVTSETQVDKIGAFMLDTPVLKFKGKDIPIDNPEELIALAQKGFSFEDNMASIKPQKKALSIIEGIPLDVLQALSDLNGGKKDAISYLKSTYGIQDKTNDLDPFGDEPDQPAPIDSTYTPEVKEEDPIQEIWDDFASGNQVAAAKVSEAYAEIDESFKAEIYNPQVFPSFIKSVSTGEFDKVYPLAIKAKSLNPGMTWLQAYTAAMKGQPQATNVEPPKSARPIRDVSTPTGGATDRADQVWNDEAYYKEVEAKLFS